ncbi:MFS transporter [Paenibacillus athensensis]|uniref:Major facilitator superfamily (MFS) profile domain-containing protein n=1 Tax=Paenibacillus athensensis TaxID=1967502 RepID=A0A4Y8QAJ5_9BACL|nr:MFS transporter [Paenibacillus athensensis]MCD1259994.1 MFS transporter [Paenibacillus athensensis]
MGDTTGYDPKRWLMLSVIIMATFMVVLDTFIVNVALTSISQTLHAGFSKLQLIIAGYVLGYAVLLITGGRLGDMFGRKRLFLIGVAGFVLTSVWCGFAGGANMLIAARIFQGISAAAMVPQVLSLIQVIFPVEERAKALGIYGAVMGLGGISGQIVGGLLLQADWWGMGWRLVFLVNLPIGVIAFVAAVWVLRESYAPERKRLDTAGVALATAGLVLLIYPLVVGRDNGWPWWSYASFLAAAVCLTIFVVFEKSLLHRGASPLLPLGLFAQSSFRRGMYIALVFYSGNAALYFVLSVFMQAGLGFTPLHSAYTFLPMGVGFFAASLLAPKLKQRYGQRLLQAGALLMIAGYGLLIGQLERQTAFVWSDFIVALLIAGAGQGAVASPLVHTALSRVQGAYAGAASGVLNTFTQVAQALGIAAIGTMFQSLLAHSGAAAALSGYGPALRDCLLVLIALAAVTFALIGRLGAGAVAQPQPRPAVAAESEARG